MTAILSWLSTLPAPVAAFFGALVSFIGTIIVAAVAFCGVRLQIRHENRRFESRLKHEAEQKVIERAMEMKREVFMTVCEGLSAGQQYLAKFADTELPRDDHEKIIAQVLPKVNRVHAIANSATLDSLIQAYECFVAGVLELQLKRFPITVNLGELNRLEAALNDLHKLQESFQAKLQEIKALAQNPPLEQFLRERLHSLQQEIENIRKKQNDLISQRFSMQLDLASLALQRSLDFDAFQAKAIVAMRAELCFPIDADRYEKTLNGVRERTKQKFLEYMKALKTAVAPK